MRYSCQYTNNHRLYFYPKIHINGWLYYGHDQLIDADGSVKKVAMCVDISNK